MAQENIIHTINSKREYLFRTIVLLKDNTPEENIKDELNKAMDSIAHLAPEIMDYGWQKINNICSMCLPHSKTCKTSNVIFTDRYNTYREIFKLQKENHQEPKIKAEE